MEVEGGYLSAYRIGQVTLDPFPHIRREPVGTVILPLLVYLKSGWMIGWASAPYDPVWAKAHPKRQALMALAGPLANLAIVLTLLALFRIGIATGFLTTPFFPDPEHLVVSTHSDWLYIAAHLGSIALYLNSILFLFNMIPVPPLDGFSVLEGVLPKAAVGFHDKVASHPALRWGGIILTWFAFPIVGRLVFQFITRLVGS